MSNRHQCDSGCTPVTPVGEWEESGDVHPRAHMRQLTHGGLRFAVTDHNGVGNPMCLWGYDVWGFRYALGEVDWEDWCQVARVVEASQTVADKAPLHIQWPPRHS